MPDALIGHTGFVGGNLAAQHRFDAWYNSKNVEAVRGRRFDTLVVSGMPAAMWVANANPDADRACLDRLWGCVSECRPATVVVVSTVAVYPVPTGVDEDSPIDETAQTPYGRHRLELERRAAAHFPRVLSVRLPALYGPGLKKNALYDLLHNNQVEKVHADAAYQFYPLGRLWRDIRTALDAGLSVVNLATEPVTMREVGRAAFGRAFDNDPGTAPARYDVRTRHAGVFGGRGGYVEDRGRVLAGLAAFVAAERRQLAEAAA
jgi:nucleoside-diphosphate-sugar epimerase